MLRHAPDSEAIRLRELKAKRKTVWRRYENNPNETLLAAKLKIIDDQIAALNYQSEYHATKIDDPKVATVPKVGCLFVLLAVSQNSGTNLKFARGLR